MPGMTLRRVAIAAVRAILVVLTLAVAFAVGAVFLVPIAIFVPPLAGLLAIWLTVYVLAAT
jgi:hypothetical protein